MSDLNDTPKPAPLQGRPARKHSAPGEPRAKSSRRRAREFALQGLYEWQLNTRDGDSVDANIRELEGALNRVIANANFTGRAITIDFVREALRDLLALQEKLVTIDNIQKTVAEYYKIKVADLLSKRRSRSVARPRQMAMALAKELTNHSLPEIGDAFGGRDHTTVLHACRKIEQLREESHDIKEDFSNLIRTLSS